MTTKASRKLNNKGAAMVLTIVIILVVMIFAFSLILISYTLYSSQTKNLSASRNAEAVNTLSVALEKELTDSNAASNSNLWKYLRCNIAYPENNFKDWPYYYEADSGEPQPTNNKEYAYRYFTVEHNSDIEGFPAVIHVGICWMLPEETTDSNINDVLTRMGSDSITTAVAAKNGIQMRIEMTAETGSQTYRVTDTYVLKVFEQNDAVEMAKIEAIKGNTQNNPASHDISTKEKWVWSLKERR